MAELKVEKILFVSGTQQFTISVWPGPGNVPSSNEPIGSLIRTPDGRIWVMLSGSWGELGSNIQGDLRVGGQVSVSGPATFSGPFAAPAFSSSIDLSVKSAYGAAQAGITSSFLALSGSVDSGIKAAYSSLRTGVSASLGGVLTKVNHDGTDFSGQGSSDDPLNASPLKKQMPGAPEMIYVEDGATGYDTVEIAIADATGVPPTAPCITTVWFSDGEYGAVTLAPSKVSVTAGLELEATLESRGHSRILANSSNVIVLQLDKSRTTETYVHMTYGDRVSWVRVPPTK